jgi:hypothetical protein
MTTDSQRNATTAARLGLSPRSERVVAGLLLLAAVVVLIQFFERLPVDGTSLGLDWHGIWARLQGGRPDYGSGMHVTPWVAVWLLPLGWLSWRASWGVVSLATLAVLVASVPRSGSRRLHWLAVVLLATSHLAVRQLADGNVEALVIAGVLLLRHGYQARKPWALAAGGLLATAKPQETWLLMLVVAVYVLRAWPWRLWLPSAGLAALVVAPSLLWLGADWLGSVAAFEFRGTAIDISLAATASRLHAPGWLLAAAWALVAASTVGYAWHTGPSLSREKAGLLVAASLLLAPYAAGNSFLAVLAVGVIPLVVARQLIGLLVILASDLNYLLLAPAVQRQWGPYFGPLLLCLTWGLLLYTLARGSRQPPPGAAAGESLTA